MDIATVRRAYQYWAPVYDSIWGPISDASRRHALEIINTRRGRLLEVGVGTGLSLPRYGRHLEVTGIDISPDMLEKARDRVRRERLSNITGLCVMDARALAFADHTFDTVVASFVMRSVPNPDRVMSEIERVCAPGGEVILVNFLGKSDGLIGRTERQLSPLARRLGWNPGFEMDAVLRGRSLSRVASHPLRPFGLFTLLRLVRCETQSVHGAGAPAGADADLGKQGELSR